MNTEILLIEAEAQNPIAIFTQNGLSALLDRIATKARAEVPDVLTNGGRKRVASIAYAVSRSKTTLDEAGKNLVEGWKKQSAAVDSERRRARQFLDELRDEVRRPLTEWEEREERRLMNLRDRLFQFRVNADLLPTSAEISNTLSRIEAIPIEGFEEFTEEAARLRDEAIRNLRAAFIVKRDEEIRKAEEERRQIEAEETARREREERIAREAAERARLEAESRAKREREEAERARLEAEAKARRELEEAERKAELERLRLEREALLAEHRARESEERAQREREQAERRAEEATRRERERIEAERRAEEEAAQKREANRAHRTAVNRKAAEAMAAIILKNSGRTPEDIALAMVAHIAKGAVPGVTIHY